jgi:aspartate carbamoyltransferase catalytic subunit
MVDTAKNIEAMGVDVFVIRHNSPGAPKMLADAVKASVVNAGDGAHEHPSQGLLDIFTIREKKREVRGLRVAIIGDVSHSRVARSNIHGLIKLGAHVTVCGPPTLVPPEMAHLGVAISHDLDKVVAESDVLNILRIQFERQGRQTFPSVREYTKLFGVTRERMRHARPDLLIMHPGPINRGVELAPSVADGPHSVILEQVTNGVAVRMAILYLVAGPGTPEGAAESKPRKAAQKTPNLFAGMEE